MRMTIAAIAVASLIGLHGVANAQSLPSKPVYDRLDSQLNEVVAEALRSSELAASRRAPISDGATVAVTIRLALDPSAVRSALVQLGVSIANEAENVIEAYVPVSVLTRVASIPGVVRVAAIMPPADRIVGQGAAAHNAVNWNANGYTGAGVKVGIIDSFGGYASLIGTELPAPAGIRCYTAVGVFIASLSACGTSVHGTAVAEALIDIAPSAALYIAVPFLASRSPRNSAVDGIAGRQSHQFFESVRVGWPWRWNVTLYEQSRSGCDIRRGGWDRVGRRCRE